MATAAVGTAVVAGTAGAVHHHQNKKYAEQDYEEQQQYQEQQAPPPEEYAAPPEQEPETDMVAKLEELGELHASGVLTDEEFTAAKAKLLAD